MQHLWEEINPDEAAHVLTHPDIREARWNPDPNWKQWVKVYPHEPGTNAVVLRRSYGEPVRWEVDWSIYRNNVHPMDVRFRWR